MTCEVGCSTLTVVDSFPLLTSIDPGLAGSMDGGLKLSVECVELRTEQWEARMIHMYIEMNRNLGLADLIVLRGQLRLFEP